MIDVAVGEPDSTSSIEILPQIRREANNIVNFAIATISSGIFGLVAGAHRFVLTMSLLGELPRRPQGRESHTRPKILKEVHQ